MNDRVVLVTGATAGIGRVTALEIARLGASVVLVGRDEPKTQAVALAIQRDTGNRNVDYLLADLGSLTQSMALAEQVKARYSRLDVLVNNVGAVFFSRGVTSEGFENTFALNYLIGRFALTLRLLDLLQASAPARIVNVSSSAHWLGRIHFDDLGLERRYAAMRAYSQAKLADVMFTYELARRTERTGVTANVLHPGVVSTNFLLTNNRASPLTRLMRWATDLFAIDEVRGAETSVYLATSPAVDGATGQYFVQKRARRSSLASYRVADQVRLWEMSEELLLARMPEPEPSAGSGKLRSAASPPYRFPAAD